MPRSAGLLRSSARRPITSLNFTFTDLGRLFDAATQLLKPDSAPSSIREREYTRRAPASRPWMMASTCQAEEPVGMIFNLFGGAVG
jgi:hypothetical protein